MSDVRHTYIIAEVGQNHNGSMSSARDLIDMVAASGLDPRSGERFKEVDAVKFTKRDLDEELTEEAGDRIYESPHSFGHTYREHREALELTYEQHAELETYARARGLDFVETICSPGALRLLDYVKVDAIKIASRDVTNIPLLIALSERSERVILSTGMCSMEELRQALGILKKRARQIDILHCISEYPSRFENINLKSIEYLQEQFPEHTIGFSDHSLGILAAPVATAMGARIIEKHVTLDRTMKGSDHAGSLEGEGLWRVVRDIRHIEEAVGTYGKEINGAVLDTRAKLARSLALRLPMQEGETLTSEHLMMLSPGTGMRWDEVDTVIGKRAVRRLKGKVLIDGEDFR